MSLNKLEPGNLFKRAFNSVLMIVSEKDADKLHCLELDMHGNWLGVEVVHSSYLKDMYHIGKTDSFSRVEIPNNVIELGSDSTCGGCLT